MSRMAAGRFLERFVDLTVASDRPLLHHYATGAEARAYTARGLADAAWPARMRIGAVAKPGALAFIISHDPFQQVTWWLGALLAGAVPGILTPPTPKLDRAKYFQDLAEILAAYPTAAVFYGDGVFENQPTDVRCHAIGAPAFEAAPERIPLPAMGRDLIFQQSSGTTGLRKGVLISESAAVRQLDSYGQ